MDPIALLNEEHRLILSALDALDGYATALSDGRPVTGGDLERFVLFIREFADARHHGKEENVLFETMVEAGFPREGGPIAVMLMEHDENRVLTRTMAEGIGRETSWNDAERLSVARAAKGYVDLLRQHIFKEDNILYPMASNHLPPELYARVTSECERIEAERGPDEVSRFRGVVEELVARYAGAKVD